MTRALTAAVTALVITGLAAGCGGSRRTASYTTTPPTTQRQARTTSVAVLTASARRALRANYRVAVYVLWHNKLPAGAASSTRGPALAALRTAAAARQKRGVRVRMLAHRREITSLRLDPSYTTAAVILVDHQRVQPSGLDGHPLGKTVTLDERGRYELRRLGATHRFVVWKVVQLG